MGTMRVERAQAEEALTTMVSEGCGREQAFLIEGKDGPVVVYVMEVEDVERSKQATVTGLRPTRLQTG